MLGLFFYLCVVVIIQFFKIKNLDLKLTVLNDKEYRTTVYDKHAYYISLLGGEAYVKEINTINYYWEFKYNIPSLRQGEL